MPPRKKPKRAPPVKKPKSAPPVVSVPDPDHINALPDHMLHHVLSFLPVQAAVRTCVLARRWRHLWRSTTGLRIVGLDDEKHAQVHHLRKFMHHLLVLRERTDLDTVEIKLGGFMSDDQPYVNLWSRFAVMCKVRALTLHNHSHARLLLDGLPFASRHLRTLDLRGVVLEKTFLDFANCPALEGLNMKHCSISVDRISSCSVTSVRHLSITGCYFSVGRRVHVSAPGVLTLKVDRFEGKTPCLENMPSLETACVYLGHGGSDVCLNYHDSGVFCGGNHNNNECKNCAPVKDDDGSVDTVLLGGVSSAKHLELISEPANFIFSRDVKHCPIFSKLKSLLLNEYWCEAPDLDPLLCILKNSPVLEKLTLQLFSKGPNHVVELKGSYNSMERPSTISEHLNIVEVKCDVLNEKIIKIMKLLCAALNIGFVF